MQCPWDVHCYFDTLMARRDVAIGLEKPNSRVSSESTKWWEALQPGRSVYTVKAVTVPRDPCPCILLSRIGLSASGSPGRHCDAWTDVSPCLHLPFPSRELEASSPPCQQRKLRHSYISLHFLGRRSVCVIRSVKIATKGVSDKWHQLREQRGSFQIGAEGIQNSSVICKHPAWLTEKINSIAFNQSIRCLTIKSNFQEAAADLLRPIFGGVFIKHSKHKENRSPLQRPRNYCLEPKTLPCDIKKIRLGFE